MTTRFSARNSFWLGYANPNPSALTLMTPEFRGFVGRRCTNGCLVLNILRDEFAELAPRWKQDFPNLKILRYAKVQQISEDRRRPDGSFFDDAWKNRRAWCVLLKATGEPRFDNGLLWMNITKAAYRAAIVPHLADEVRNSGCDGLVLDSHHWELHGYNAIQNGAWLNAYWQAGAMAILDELRGELGPNYTVMFNGLWGFKGEKQATKQGEMLAFADGITVEFFGVDGHGPASKDSPSTEWQFFVGNLNAQLIARGRGKYAHVNGQRHNRAYADYAEDYAVGLYCYANYLLGPLDPKHGFHYGNLQCRKLPRERTGGYDYFDFQDLRLGPPLKDVVQAFDSGKARVFKGGVVLVAPARGAQGFALQRSYYTMAGKVVGPGIRKVRARAAEILLTDRPIPPPATLKVYSNGLTTGPKKEWMVQPVKSGWYRYKVLNLRVRSTDVKSAILVRVEIDNEPITHGIVVIRPESAKFIRTENDYPYGETPNGVATSVYAPITYTTDNEWNDLSLKLDPALGKTCFRVVSVRVIGSARVSRITLTGRTAL